jgi:hypothetical protein
MDLSQRLVPTPGLTAGVLNSIVAKDLPHKLLNLFKFVFAWPPPTRTIRVL